MIFLLVLLNRNKNRYDNVNCTLDFAPGLAGGIYPDIRQIIAVISLPFTNLVEWHSIINPLALSSAKSRCTVASGMPVSSAISLSERSPCFFRYRRISFIGKKNCLCPLFFLTIIYFLTPFTAALSVACLECRDLGYLFISNSASSLRFMCMVSCGCG